MNILIRSTIAVLILSIGLCRDANPQAPSGWPIEPVSSEHPLGNTLGEFQSRQLPLVYQHTGIDILAKAYDPGNPGDAPWVTVTVGGVVDYLTAEPSTRDNETTIDGEDGVRYRYLHLSDQFYDPNMVISFYNNQTVAVSSGDRLAQVAPYGCANVSYDHLHYDMKKGTAYLNPLLYITPNLDPLAPDIFDVNLAVNDSNPWTKFDPPKSACTVVKGKLDIIAHLRDRDDAGSSLPGAANVGVYKIRWRPCPKSNPNCGDWKDTHDFDDMPEAWDTANADSQKQFSIASPWVSGSDECSTGVNQTFMVPTSRSLSGSWDTAVGFPDGSYTVSVEASDYADNVTTHAVHVCVQNGAACTTDLAIRDGTNDAGATPYGDSTFWMSPDIKVNRGTVDEDRNIKTGRANVVEVQVQNTGSCTLPVGSTYTVCLGWSAPSGSVPHPIPANQTVGCQAQTVGGTGWTPGTGKLTSFSWTPVAGSLPLGDNSLVAWSDMPVDPAQATPSVILDNNRAQRNIAFTDSPEPLPPSDLIVE